MKVAINKCYGGFTLSKEARSRILATAPALSNLSEDDKEFRTNPVVIQVVEEMGREASAVYLSNIRVAEVPDGTSWHIANYDGLEWIAEDHRTWGND